LILACDRSRRTTGMRLSHACRSALGPAPSCSQLGVYANNVIVFEEGSVPPSEGASAPGDLFVARLGGTFQSYDYLERKHGVQTLGHYCRNSLPERPHRKPTPPQSDRISTTAAPFPILEGGTTSLSTTRARPAPTYSWPATRPAVLRCAISARFHGTATPIRTWKILVGTER